MGNSNSFARIPHTITDALRRGEINVVQSLILWAMHTKADWATGEVHGWSAEQFLLAMNHPKDLDFPTVRTIRHYTQLLREAGWFHSDYLLGSKRPYRVWLHNYVISATGASRQDISP